MEEKSSRCTVPSWALEGYALAKGGRLALTSPCGKGGILLRVVAIRLMGWRLAPALKGWFSGPLIPWFIKG